MVGAGWGEVSVFQTGAAKRPQVHDGLLKNGGEPTGFIQTFCVNLCAIPHFLNYFIPQLILVCVAHVVRNPVIVFCRPEYEFSIKGGKLSRLLRVSNKEFCLPVRGHNHNFFRNKLRRTIAIALSIDPAPHDY